MKHPTHITSASQLLFGILFPEGSGVCALDSSAAHCVIRAMEHLSGRPSNTYPSTKEGVLIPFSVKVG